jgi:NAD(P)-dependent dehydrogenase (short-subunit alcohol dehydrogenase family)
MADALPLRGMAALVTGGSGAIGSASARWLLRDGCSITLMARRAEHLEGTAERLRAEAPEGTTVQTITGDGVKKEDVQAAVAYATRPTGHLNIAVATVGGGTMVPVLAMDEADFLGDLEKNIFSAFLVVKYAAPKMVEAGGGSIVFISSDVARLAWPFLSGYCAGKTGLEAMMRAAADELGPLKVRLNAVRPGLVRTGNNDRLFEPEINKLFLEQKPLGRTGVPDDIAAGVRYLAGPESSWVTGQSFGIEGGNELRKAPLLENLIRKRWGDEVIDAALAGRNPGI